MKLFRETAAGDLSIAWFEAFFSGDSFWLENCRYFEVNEPE